ncbi:membrane protein [Arenicella chitinivorans]|uniref:Membrane protein n=1 Tax=Arenicella chitinivorans TaxID=1329800 RepID=A0A918VRX6_9GAMM|nr:YeeE/YedE thiosulfate transporter family protein [Arenicella chitinivorans]GHA17395.1 membrane protein [Arenicella chitinivorans]
MMHDFIYALIGGGLIGVATVLLMAAEGNILGISGILSRSLTPPTEHAIWRWVFLAGLMLSPVILLSVTKLTMPLEITPNPWLLAIAGLLVGLGTVIGNGCTSGHGVCGISRMSPRSIVATSVFIGTAVATVAVMNLATGG